MDATTPLAQAHALVQLGLHLDEDQRSIAARNRARAAAYLWLAHESQGQILLEHWALWLLQTCETPYQEGARRFVLQVFAHIKDAPQELRQLGELLDGTPE